ncbi:hypothetical protein [Paraburkholderia sp. SIMBA_054]|uniref:hypothetical protein n=1 Tax=Paraburkholderia sp. SIMBA_054 TaxID=3085795 RepID=UPI00397D9A33
MPYLGSPFFHDVFISYAHGPPSKQGPGNLARWSEAFAHALRDEIIVNPRLRKYRQFLDIDHEPDSGVDPLAPLTDGLEEHIRGAAILLVLMTQDYLLSQWCRRERESWCAHQPQIGLADNDRIAVVRAMPTDEPWPRELVDVRGEQLPGFAFHPPADRRQRARDPPVRLAGHARS